MPLISCFKSSFVKKNPTIGEILSVSDVGNKDNRYSKEEVSLFLNSSVKAIFNVFNDGLVNRVFKWMDNGSTKDGYITHKEIDSYLKENFDISLSEFKDMTLKEACKFLDERS